MSDYIATRDLKERLCGHRTTWNVKNAGLAPKRKAQDSTSVMNGATRQMFFRLGKRPCVKAIVHTGMKREYV